MKNLVIALALTLAAAFAPAARAATVRGPQTFVAVATFTTTGTMINSVGFTTNNLDQDIFIQNIYMASCTTATVLSGRLHFWIHMTSTQTAGPVLNVSSFAYAGALTGAGNGWPGGVIMSTSPTSVTFETNNASLPMFPPCFVSAEESGTTFRNSTCYEYNNTGKQALILPRNSWRGFVFRQMPYTSSIGGGCVMASVEFTVE